MTDWTNLWILGHTAISVAAIVFGVWVLVLMVSNREHQGLTGAFLLLTALTSMTGFIFFSPPNPPTPGQLTGVVALAVMVPTLYAYYFAQLVGTWRATYVVGAVFSLWINTFTLVFQLFVEIPSPYQPQKGQPPTHPVFAVAEGLVLLVFVWAGGLALTRYRGMGRMFVRSA